ncbi:hypothetical protein N7455_007107 [Penicillium solitum]|uniref:uncharacterized protein n=1 Tax=Penicillium solitum TaxID=60172 RepID=UPI0032C48D12|nr:hypothetical protein N7455_007107 [Penicillium solitum]
MTQSRPQIDQYWHKGGICGLVCRAALRTLQFVLAVTVAGIYGVDLAHATKTNQHANAEWVYAEFVAALSAITCILHCFVTVTRVGWSAWDGVLFVLWLAQVGVFGSAYAFNVQNENKDATLSIQRMRVAVWLDLISMLLWFATTVLGIAWCIRTRKVTRRTDRLDTIQKEHGSLCGEQNGSSGEEKGLLIREKASLEAPSPGKCAKSTDNIESQSEEMKGVAEGDT